ncbi:hypothetical protein KY362_03665 [Candidatus Woesearchaeota archaeon]|nr:hypothetical protein [Candidatus Woesearchaeota archaeon]
MKRAITISIIMILLASLLLAAGCAKDAGEDKGQPKQSLKGLDAEAKELFGAAAVPEPVPTSFQNIYKALEEDRISKDEWAMLIILANYDPDRLPDELKGRLPKGRGPIQDASYYVDTHWDELSPEVQEVLYPFHVPPDHPDSFFNPYNRKGSNEIIDELSIIPSVDAYDGNWEYMDFTIATGQTARVLYANDSTKQKAEWVKEAVQTSWPKHRDLLGKKPGQRVYLFVRNMGSDYGEATMDDLDEDGTDQCKIGIGDRYDKKTTQSTTAHELFHCFQFYMPNEFEGERRWLMEATATWSEHYVYPDYNSEWEYLSNFFPRLDSDMVKFDGENEYSTYTWYLFLTQFTNNPSFVKDALVAAKTKQGRDAAVSTVSNFDLLWERYALWNWNRDPAEIYQDAPKFPTDTLNGDFMFPNGASLSSWNYEQRKEYPEALAMEKLGMAYHVATFTDDIKKVVFRFEKDSTEKHRRQALIKIGDVWHQEDWNGVMERRFCRTRPEEKVDKVVLIVSNSDADGPVHLEGLTIDTRDECAPEWHGTTTWMWGVSGGETIPKNFLSGETSISWKQNSFYTSYDTLVYDEENDEFLVKDQFVSYRFHESETISYVQDCGPLRRTRTEDLAGGTQHSWDVDPERLWESNAPDRLRASDDDAWEYEVDLDIGNQVSDFISSLDHRTRTYRQCELHGISTPTEESGTTEETFDGITGFFKNSPNDITARMSDDGKRITASKTVIEQIGGKDVPIRVTVDYAYG